MNPKFSSEPGPRVRNWRISLLKVGKQKRERHYQVKECGYGYAVWGYEEFTGEFTQSWVILMLRVNHGLDILDILTSMYPGMAQGNKSEDGVPKRGSKWLQWLQLCQVSSHLCIDQVHKGVASEAGAFVSLDVTWESKTTGFPFSSWVWINFLIHFKHHFFGAFVFDPWPLCNIYENHPHEWTGASIFQSIADWLNVCWGMTPFYSPLTLTLIV